ncbi:MAG: paraquat-inducible protein A [Magnetococcales bacterium]|nr:paraquat-inducible protein A [Magnetococcales bacterium]
MATVIPGPALFYYAGSLLALLGAQAFLDPELLWERLPRGATPTTPGQACGLCGLPCGEIDDDPPHAPLSGLSAFFAPMRAGGGGILREIGFFYREVGRFLGQQWRRMWRGRCRRCGAPAAVRKPASVSRSWALTVAAGILYLPANLLPIMTVVRLGRVQSDTILSGVAHLAASGMWFLAAVVFVASVLVPVLKLLALAGLLLAIQFGQEGYRQGRTRLYRWVERIGRWSMIDLFVIAILVAIVDLGDVATVHPGPGALYFGAVVVITLLAARTFDPRLIWE